MDPASLATMAGSLAQGAAAVHSGLKIAHHLGAKYIPIAKRAANMAFSPQSRQTAKDYLKGLTTAKGLQKAVTKDLPQAAKAASKFVSSGKLVRGAKEVAGDVGKAVSAVEGITGSNKYTKGVQQAVASGLSAVHGVHEAHNQFVSDFAKHSNRRAVGMS